MAGTLTQLGRYRILGELGRGAMGVVYRAEDPALDRTVAIKTIVLSGDAAERASYEARFLQEARAAGRLSHPAIITIYDVGREGDLAYMAMELLGGVDLRARLSESVLPLDEALTIAAQVAEGLGFAHEHGVVHRDIKPGNIMLLRDGRAKLMDFGIARIALSDVKTQTGIVLGTPKYMSPEQVAGRTVDARSDIFSLGSVLYESIVGRPPFSGSDTTQLMQRIATVPHAAPSRIVSGLPALIDLILARALAKDPAARYQDAREFAADLRACLTDLLVAGSPEASGRYAASNATAATQRLAPADDTQPLAGPPTERLGTDPVGATRTIEAIECWPVSQRFDSAAALERLLRPSPADSTRFTTLPRPARGLARLLRDPVLRGATLMLLSAAAAAALIVLG